jgi:hypothetical protein
MAVRVAQNDVEFFSCTLKDCSQWSWIVSRVYKTTPPPLYSEFTSPIWWMRAGEIIISLVRGDGRKREI